MIDVDVAMSELPAIAAAAKMLKARKLSCVELVELVLARIERLERQVHAWVRVDAKGARRAARAADAALCAGRWRGPLHGIPLGIKDIIDVAGWPTEAGSKLRTGRIASDDAPVVRRLREAGAILLGKTATCEFACFDPSPARNPWNLDRTPGGSSSGSAAAVAAGMCLGALGTQTGGSIARPASYCGVAGCKPTFGLVDRRGIVPVSEHLDHVGPIARTVEDLQILLSAMAGWSDQAGPIFDRTPRLAVVRAELFERAEPSVAGAFAGAVSRLRAAGATVDEMRLPCDFDSILRWHRAIMAVEAAAVHAEAFRARRDQFGPQLTTLLDEGLATPRAAYEEALTAQSRLAAESLRWIPADTVLLTPATVDTAPDLSTTGRPWFNSPWSFLGLPTVSLPCGLAENDLPVAVQLIGRAWGECELLAAAGWCERAFGFAAQPPLGFG